MIGLTKQVLKRPVSVIVLVAALIIFGVKSISGMYLQLIPDIDMPIQLLICTYPGANPEDVEKLVTRPIEDGCSTISGVTTTSSYSMENMGMVMMSFDYGTDMDKAFIDIMQAMEMVKMTLPDEAGDPTVIAMDVNATPVLSLSVETNNPVMDPLAYVNEVVTPELEKNNDIAQVNVSGGRSEYISVELIPELLSEYRLNITSIANTVRDANFTVPAGTADYGGQTVNASATAEYKTPEELGTIPITTATGDVIHLSDVANVHYAYDTPTSYSRHNGGEDVSVSITKTQTASTVTLSRAVQKTLDRLNEENPDYNISVTYDSAETIVNSLATLGKTLVLGILITMIILLLFFGDVKGSLIVASSMPVSVLATVVLMSLIGFSLNLMTLGALVIAIGMMVDNSIVVIEMCFRKQEEGGNFYEASIEGTSAVMNSIIASTITTVVVYLPISMIEGLSGQLFGQLGYTIVFALMASLISAVTLVPLCFYAYKPVAKTKGRINDVLNKISNAYKRMIQKALDHKKLTAFAAIGIFAVSILLAQFVNTELIPSSDEGRVTINVTFRPGTSLENIDKKIKEIEAFVSESDYVKSYSSTAGGGSGMNAMMSSGDGRVSVELKDKIKTEKVVEEWNPIIQEYADSCIIDVSSSSESFGVGAQGGSGYEVNLNGTELERLKAGAGDVASNISTISGVLSVSSSLAESESRADIVVDPIKAAASNLTPGMAAGTIYSLVNGSDVFKVTIDDNEYTVSVEYPQDTYEDINDLMGITLTNTVGMEVPLIDIADIVFTDSPTTIIKTDGEYVATITASLENKSKYKTQKAIDDMVNSMSLPAGVDNSPNSLTEMMNEEFSTLLGAIITAILLVYIVMAIQFNNLIYSLVVMFCIPFSIIGSILLLLISRATLNMTSLMGFLMLVGIVVNNGIIYVDYSNSLIEQGMEVKEALIESGLSRLRPILMTTLTTILSMIPMGLGIGRNGQMTQGMALVIIGGLTASTVLTLILIPTIYLIVQKLSIKRKR